MEEGKAPDQDAEPNERKSLISASFRQAKQLMIKVETDEDLQEAGTSGRG